MVFKKLGLAVTFSPTGRSLLAEAGRLKKLFNAELILIHVGEKNYDTENALNDLIKSAGLNITETKIVWKTGNAVKKIMQFTMEAKIDLLLLGALEKESFVKYYFGSIARKLMREFPCSILVLSEPSLNPKSFKKICVSADYSVRNENTIKIAYEIARMENAEDFVLLREFRVPGLAIAVYDSGSVRETEKLRAEWLLEEQEKMKVFARELNLTGLNMNIICLYGKRGWEANNFVKENNFDLLVVTAPKRKLKLYDRIFQNNLEFIFKELHGSLLIHQNPNKYMSEI